MTTETAARLTPKQRLARGLADTATGPVDVTRGTLGLTAQSIAATTAAIGRGYRKGKLRRQLRKEAAAAKAAIGQELAAAQDAVQALPQTLAEARSQTRRGGRRALLLGATGVAVLAVGAALFTVVRRSRQPEPSPLPPSVRIEPQP